MVTPLPVPPPGIVVETLLGFFAATLVDKETDAFPATLAIDEFAFLCLAEG
jgi:hypothetical protein